MNKLPVMIFTFFLMLGFTFAATSGVSVTVSNSNPTIVSVSAPAAVDPAECTTSSIGTIQVNVTDDDGYADITLGSSYVNVTKGAVSHLTTSCVEDSSSGNWIVMNCTGATFDYYDTPAADWTLWTYVEDGSAASDTDTSTSMTLNSGVLMRANNTPITFGTVTANTNDNVDTSSFFLENCGNVVLNNTITGANITDGGSNSIAASQFRADDDATPSEGGETDKAELTLSEAAQAYSKTGGLAVQGTYSLYHFLDVPLGQAQASYSTGTWTYTPSAA